MGTDTTIWQSHIVEVKGLELGPDELDVNLKIKTKTTMKKFKTYMDVKFMPNWINVRTWPEELDADVDETITGFQWNCS